MYLSRLILNARHPRTRSEFDHPYEMHRTLCKAWENPETARVLFRTDQDKPGVASVVIQSTTEPDWSRLDVSGDYLRNIEGPKEVMLAALTQGQQLMFCLRARPSKRVGSPGSAEVGKRVTLRDKEEVFSWLHRKADQNGFKVYDAAFDRVYWFDSKGGVQNKPLGGVVFNGTLIVTDPDKLREAVCNGIGPQKAFGFGLLSLAPIR